MNIPSKPEEFLYCARSKMNLARNYDEYRVYSSKEYLRIDLIEVWSSGECEISLIFDRGVLAYFRTDEVYAIGRSTAMDYFNGLKDYEPWPLFEIKNSQRLALFGIKNDLCLQGLRHFFVSTDSRFTDVFAYYPPRMIVRNQADCNGKKHRDGVSCPEKDNIEFRVT